MQLQTAVLVIVPLLLLWILCVLFDRDSCKLAVFGIVPLLCLWILCVLFDRHSSGPADVIFLLDYTSC
jgi:hypothetical protein